MVRQAARRVAPDAANVELAAPVTISRLARHFGLARSTLLHYDRIGLLKAGAKTAAGYRLYGGEAIARLARIVELRGAGLPLDAIKRVIESRQPLADALEKQVQVLNQQIGSVRAQQRVVLSLLQATVGRIGATAPATGLSKQSWTALFQAIGMSDADMHQWHVNFERSMPDAHRQFLESLGLDADEIRRIRDQSGG